MIYRKHLVYTNSPLNIRHYTCFKNLDSRELLVNDHFSIAFAFLLHTTQSFIIRIICTIKFPLLRAPQLSFVALNPHRGSCHKLMLVIFYELF